MAVTTEKSTQVTNEDNGVANEAPLGHGQLCAFEFSFTQGAAAGDANSTADLVYLPPGKWRYIGAAPSACVHSAFGTGRTLDIGHAGYTDPSGATVSADEDAIHSAAAIASAGNFVPGDEITADQSLVINSRTRVLIRAKCESGTIPAAATLKGRLVFSR